MKKDKVVLFLCMLIFVSTGGLTQTTTNQKLKNNSTIKDKAVSIITQDNLNNTLKSKVTVKTVTIKEITSTNAICSYSITTENEKITRQGVCLGKGQNPTIANNIFSSKGLGPINFSAEITGLSPSTKYYARAFATTTSGTTYGNVLSFTTLPKKK